jgi:transcription elongation factor GreA
MAETFLTRAGYEKLVNELEPLRKQKNQLSLDIDLKENAEYHSAKEKLGEIMTRIAKIQDKLEGAKIIDELRTPKGQVAIGCFVKLKDEDGDMIEYTLVGEDESDPAEGKISVYSPLAQGLLGKKVGETVTVDLPAGPRQFKVLASEPAA